MTSVEIRLTGAQEVSMILRSADKRLKVELPKLVRHHGQLLRTRVRGKASGRPGPRAITGDYRRSWELKVSGGSTETKAEVGTNAVQGRRLEFGFAGADSLGRVYNQPPYPHARPAFDEQAPEFQRGGEALIERLVGR